MNWWASGVVFSGGFWAASRDASGPMTSAPQANVPAIASIRAEPASRRHAWPRRQRDSSCDRPCDPPSRRSIRTCSQA